MSWGGNDTGMVPNVDFPATVSSAHAHVRNVSACWAQACQVTGVVVRGTIVAT